MNNYRSHYTETRINGKTVGSHHWPLSSIKSFCRKKGIILQYAQYVTYDINHGFDYENVNIITGETSFSYNSDPIYSL